MVHKNDGSVCFQYCRGRNQPCLFIYLFILLNSGLLNVLKKKSVNIAATGSDTPQFMELL